MCVQPLQLQFASPSQSALVYSSHELPRGGMESAKHVSQAKISALDISLRWVQTRYSSDSSGQLTESKPPPAVGMLDGAVMSEGVCVVMDEGAPAAGRKDGVVVMSDGDMAGRKDGVCVAVVGVVGSVVPTAHSIASQVNPKSLATKQSIYNVKSGIHDGIQLHSVDSALSQTSVAISSQVLV